MANIYRKLIFTLFLFTGGFCFLCAAQAQQFKFAFLTDLHAHSERTLHLVDSLVTAIPSDVDIIVTGGDNIDIDNLSVDQVEQGKLKYKKLKEIFERSGKPYYAAIGNHDRLPSSLRNGKDDFLVFEEFFGPTYYTFDHKGYRFIILNSVYVEDKQYIIPEQEKSWLKELLSNTPADQPVIVVTHVPFLSVYYPVLEGKYTSADTFSNQKEIFDLFSGHNLKLVLQGHMHLYEEIKVKGVPFITAGAVSGNWWQGTFHGTKPGYLLVEIQDENVSWDYVD